MSKNCFKYCRETKEITSYLNQTVQYHRSRQVVIHEFDHFQNKTQVPDLFSLLKSYLSLVTRVKDNSP